MANTYTQMYAHLIFSPQGRQNLIQPSFEEDLYRYITGIIRGKKQTLIAINGMPDHIHIFVGFRPRIAISDLVRDIKTNSARFVNHQRFLPRKFAWQSGFGCFTHSHGQLDAVATYVRNQKIHHQRRSFQEEYLALLRKNEVSFDGDYLFEFYSG